MKVNLYFFNGGNDWPISSLHACTLPLPDFTEFWLMPGTNADTLLLLAV